MPIPEEAESSNGRLGVPPPLSRHNSNNSQHSIHSQRSHSSQTHHASSSDPTSLLDRIHTMSSDEHHSRGHHAHSPHVHPQHGNLFVAQDGPTGVPSFGELVATEQRDWLEGEEEDRERSEEEEMERSGGPACGGKGKADRRKSVTFQQGTSSDGSSATRNVNEPSERDPLLPSQRDARTYSQDEDFHDPTKDPEEWARIREGSIARRSRWRRPGPYWYVKRSLTIAYTSIDRSESWT
jgi:hypothetical protein